MSNSRLISSTFDLLVMILLLARPADIYVLGALFCSLFFSGWRPKGLDALQAVRIFLGVESRSLFSGLEILKNLERTTEHPAWFAVFSFCIFLWPVCSLMNITGCRTSK